MNTTNKRGKPFFYLAASALCTALIVVCSYISIPVGHLKFTLQLLAVLFTAGMLPPVWAISSVAVYILLGAVGLPVFASFSAGLANPTGGFVVGFLPACALISVLLYFIRKKGGRSSFFICAALFAAATLIVYVCGTVGFCLYMPDKGVAYALTAAVLPYVGFDLVKILLAAFLTARLYPLLKKTAEK